MKQQTCKYISDDGVVCLSLYHSKMYHNPKTPIKRTAIKKAHNILLNAKVPKYDKYGVAVDTDGLAHIIHTQKKLRKKPTTKKAPTRSQLVKKLDTVFSQYTRQKYAIDGMTACVTCGVVKRWQEQQNGHYMSRGHIPTRWSEDNCAPQCVACNVFRKGNYVEYSLWMIDTYGAAKLTELKKRANSGVETTSVEIKEMIQKYTLLLKAID